MRNIKSILTILSGVLIAATSCVNLSDPRVGSPISFSAVSGYGNGILTRTEYSHVLNNVSFSENQYERINWVAGDKIAVNYSNAGVSYDYTVDDVSNSGVNSSASLSGSSLSWVENSSPHIFYAMYPANGFKGNNSAVLGTDGQVSGVIPASQTVKLTEIGGVNYYEPQMEYGYMVSKKTVASSDDMPEVVTLPFRPAMTAFEFRFTCPTETPAISSFQLESTAHLAGGFSLTMNGTDADSHTDPTWTADPVVSNSSNSIAISFVNEGTTVGNATPTNGVLDFTVFALPVDLTHITVRCIFADSSEKVLKLKTGTDPDNGWGIFTACRKYIITAGMPSFQSLSIEGEDAHWDFEAHGEGLIWDN